MTTTHLGFSTPRRFNPVSWAVRKLTKSRCSHTWLCYWDSEWNMDVVMEAHELGFRLIPFTRFKRENNVVRVVTLRQDIELGVRWAAKHLGDAYDFGGLLGMAWVLLGRMFKKRFNNPLQNSHAMFCSEMAVEVLKRSNVTWAKPLVASEVSPADLLEYVEAHERT
jgi:hypothetical protein